MPDESAVSTYMLPWPKSSQSVLRAGSFLDRLHDVDGGAGAVVEDATQGGGGDSNEVGKHLLVHVLRLHDLLDPVFHRSKMVFFYLFRGFSFEFTKVKLFF